MDAPFLCCFPLLRRPLREGLSDRHIYCVSDLAPQRPGALGPIDDVIDHADRGPHSPGQGRLSQAHVKQAVLDFFCVGRVLFSTHTSISTRLFPFCQLKKLIGLLYRKYD